MKPRNLWDVPGCKDPDYDHYYRWEQDVAKPALEALGYTNVRFRMGERDSFGPLSRLVFAEKDGREEAFFYG